MIPLDRTALAALIFATLAVADCGSGDRARGAAGSPVHDGGDAEAGVEVAAGILSRAIPEHSATIPVPREELWLRRHDNLNELAEAGDFELMFLGDSITHEWNFRDRGREVWDEYYGDRQAVNFGSGADRTEHILWRVENSKFENHRPRLVILMAGTNNTSLNTVEEIADGVFAIVQRLRKKLPETRILVLGIFPRGRTPRNKWRQKAAAANEIIRRIADDEEIFYLDIGSRFIDQEGMISDQVMRDYLHLTPRGYRIWAAAMEPTVAELLGER